MFPIFNLGPLAIQAPGLIILIGIYTSFLVIEKQPKIFKGSTNDLSNLIFTLLTSIIILGRLSYILKFPSIFMENPISIISLSPSLIDFGSGSILGLIVISVFIQKKKLNPNEILDALALPLIVFLLFFFFAQLASGNLYGKPSSLPWSILLWGTNRHPLQIYYMLALLPIILLTIKRMVAYNRKGVLFFKTTSALSLLFVFFDFFNGDPNNLIAGFNKIQLVGLFLLIVSNVFLLTRKKATEIKI